MLEGCLHAPLFVLKPPQAVLHADSDIRAGLFGTEVVAIAGMYPDAPAFFIRYLSFDSVGDGLVNSSRIDLQSIERNIESTDVKRVEAVSETVLPDRNRHIQGVRATINGHRVGSLLHDLHRGRAFNDHRIDTRDGHRVCRGHFDHLCPGARAAPA